ncbi:MULTISPECIES: YceI family protein [unclassified Helicobacter]|uniref:YceI family protein n=1 Tax=unclassified Helicobacter TaxID=2593540 RepID=UPI000CF180D7|nr:MULTISPECIES: YceI family protein [unclassified Helicobacter]
MKKLFFSFMALALFSGTIFAMSLDVDQAKVEWVAFKMKEKAPVKGTFSEIKYKFGKKSDSITQILEGATAMIDGASVDLGDELKNSNVKNYFFMKFNKQEPIKVTFKNVMEGDDKGTLLAMVRMNGKNVKVPMQYEIKDNMFVARGVFDIMEFGAMEAFKALATQCHDFHDGLTWTQVEISFSAPIK